MAFTDYLAVLDSDLYEYCGTTKAILSRVAHLIIAPPEEREDGKPKGEPDPHVGFCVASQEYMACQMGLSVSRIRKAIRLFENDQWIFTETGRDKWGHLHNRYRWAEGALDRVKARRRQRDERGEYVRPKQVNMERWPQGKFAKAIPQGEEPGGLKAISAVASRLSALRPQGYRPCKQVSEVDLSAGEKKSERDNQTPVSRLLTSFAGISQSPERRPPTSSDFGDPSVSSSAPVNPATPKGDSAAPRPKVDKYLAKTVCRFLNCGGPLKGNRPGAVCLKCGNAPLPASDPLAARAKAASDPLAARAKAASATLDDYDSDDLIGRQRYQMREADEKWGL